MQRGARISLEVEEDSPIAQLTEDELALIWGQVDELREDTARSLVALREGPHCNNPACGVGFAPVHTRDGDTVCPACGFVCDSGLPAVGFADGQRGYRAYLGYKPLFHLNERIANLNCTDPRLPGDLYALVKDVHSRWGYPADASLWHEHIGKILGSVGVPGRLAEKYQGKRYKCEPLTDMRKKFHERWITLRYQLTGGERPPPLTSAVVVGMQQRLVAFLIPWQKLRHTESCKGGQRCHKRHGCRFKLPDCSMLMYLFMYDIGGEELADTYKAYLFYDGRRPVDTCNDHLLRLIATCFRWNGWVCFYDDGGDEWCLEAHRGRHWTKNLNNK